MTVTPAAGITKTVTIVTEIAMTVQEAIVSRAIGRLTTGKTEQICATAYQRR
jgi:hypothetical protein